MLAYMKYENGLRFKNVVFENEKAAKLWLKQNKISNPDCYELVEVEFIKEDPKGLKKMELEEKLQETKARIEFFKILHNHYKDDEDITNKINDYITECEKIQKEIDNL